MEQLLGGDGACPLVNILEAFKERIILGSPLLILASQLYSLFLFFAVFCLGDVTILQLHTCGFIWFHIQCKWPRVSGLWQGSYVETKYKHCGVNIFTKTMGMMNTEIQLLDLKIVMLT